MFTGRVGGLTFFIVLGQSSHTKEPNNPEQDVTVS
jgi:hypothetical protein